MLKTHRRLRRPHRLTTPVSRALRSSGQEDVPRSVSAEQNPIWQRSCRMHANCRAGLTKRHCGLPAGLPEASTDWEHRAHSSPCGPRSAGVSL
ncbi:hypothetical protein NKH18_07370 [Streptomyces sp. M10(2022)]